MAHATQASIGAAVAIGIAAAFSSSAWAAGWKPIACPPTRRDVARFYERVGDVDPLNDPAAWKPASNDQTAQATTSRVEGPAAGQSALGIHYQFVGRDGLEYVDIGGSIPLPADAKALGFQMRGGPDSLPARVRLVDAGNEVHQFDVGRTVAGKWTLGVANLALSAGYWGGDGNGKLDPPFRLVSVLFDRPTGRFTGEGDLAVADLGLYRPVGLDPFGIQVFVPDGRQTLVYEPGETVRFAVTLDPAFGTGSTELTTTPVDPTGHEYGHGGMTVQPGTPCVMEFNSPGVGSYDIQFRTRARGDAPGAPWADFRFAVLPRPRPEATEPFFGVCTHFGQGWPLEVMDMLARSGMRVYRDEISWGAVEHQKGWFDVPAGSVAFVDRARSLGLSGLIILDYGNPIYDGGGFPVSEEARSAFASYAAGLARRFPNEIPQFELWNEWTGGCGMSGRLGKPEDYPALLLATEKAIREAGSKAKLIGVGGEWSGSAVTTMTSGGAGPRMDAFSVHPYCYPQLPGEPFRNNLKRLVAAAEQGAGKPLPAWLTEIGWPTHLGATGSDFLHQARCLVRAGLIAAAVPGVERVIWYDFKDDGRDLAYNENNFGLVHHEDFMLAPKPGYVAVANMIAMMDGRKVVSQAREGDLWRTVLDGDRGSVTVLWADQLDAVIKVPLPPDRKAVDMFGHPLPVAAEVDVTADPVFLVVR